MFRFLIFVDTINSIYDASKNVRGDEALGVLEVSSNVQLSGENEIRLRKQYQLEANQVLRFERLSKFEHRRNDDGETICGTDKSRFRTRRPSPFQDIFGFVNCSKCLKKLEGNNKEFLK